MKVLLFVITFVICSVVEAAEVRISDLPSLVEPDWQTNDIFLMVDTSEGKSRKTSVGDFDLRYSLPNQSGNAGKFLKTDGTTVSWDVVSAIGGYDVIGSPGSPYIVISGNGVVVNTSSMLQIFTVSTGGAVMVSANPQIQAGSVIGQSLILFGTSDVNYIILSDGNGLSLNGAVNLKNKQSLMLSWSGTEWWEVARK